MTGPASPIGPAIESAAEYLCLKAVYSRSAASARTIAEGLTCKIDIYSEDTENGLDELLKRSDIEAVVVSLPIGQQPKFIKAALLAGKHVLSEKPVAENIADAKALIEWYRREIQGPIWAVAENWRFLNSYEYAAEQIKSLGKIIGFQGRQHDIVPENWKFNLTEWRRKPTHQGGYLLDGGVHYVAGLRLLLGVEPGHKIASLSAFTNQIQPYLPPVDTADVILRTSMGVTGVFQISRGTSLRADEWTIACSHGWVKIENEKVTISRDGQIEVVNIPNERTGVPPEIRAWGQSLGRRRTLPEQEPEAALADLELIELMLKSGSMDGVPLVCSHQDVS
ncbi:NAD-binding Rossmann fold oxidoreductase family protein [Aspergillus sergii]|uniref:NAD-binding Rossmann fold oxidoreductase family protein n=1 Tax=Aspergillus sergii TaxID=1034303 RepID=A0A5N6X999_9EURO|nr:NAD-binding Rossmann fold oxidoreductase family protein [Aspergillus sergii]